MMNSDSLSDALNEILHLFLFFSPFLRNFLFVSEVKSIIQAAETQNTHTDH